MTSKFPSMLILMELAEALTAKWCELKLHWIRRDDNQLADDLTSEKFDSFDKEFRIPFKRENMGWRILDKLIAGAEGFHQEIKARKGQSPLASKVNRRRGRGSWHLGSPVGFAWEIAIQRIEIFLQDEDCANDKKITSERQVTLPVVHI